jgi:hypothetical protein
MDERLERARWLYAANAKALTAENCARQAVKELGSPRIPIDTAQIFDITQTEYTEAYIQQLISQLKGEE